VSDPDTTPLYRGQRNRATGLWNVDWRQPLPVQPTTTLTGFYAGTASEVLPMTTAAQTQRRNAHALNALRLSNNAERVRFYHAAMGSPPVVTLTKALSAGILPTLPITAELVRKTQAQTLATAKGHLDAHRQGVQSTRPRPTEERHFTGLASDQKLLNGTNVIKHKKTSSWEREVREPRANVVMTPSHEILGHQGRVILTSKAQHGGGPPLLTGGAVLDLVIPFKVVRVRDGVVTVD
jgi:hypothetical protein